MSAKSKFWIALILVLSAASAGYWYYLKIKGGGSTATSPAYVFGDNLNAVFTQSTQKSDVGGKITFIGLKTDSPKVLFASGVETGLKKTFENEETLSLVQVATVSGGIDAFVINKKTGTFSRAWAGNLFGAYSGSALGYCR